MTKKFKTENGGKSKCAWKQHNYPRILLPSTSPTPTQDNYSIFKYSLFHHCNFWECFHHCCSSKKSLHPASKLLLSCLATTDLGVGVITHPILYSYLMSPEHSKLCYYSKILLRTMGSIFAGVSLHTVTAISVDRLLALLLGLRYRHVVTFRRV